MPCRCPRRGLLNAAPSLESIAVERRASLPGKAMTVVPGPLLVLVDSAWYDLLSSTERAAVLAHELAHHESGCANGERGADHCPMAPRACEACADRRAGAVLRQWGISLDSSMRAFRRVVHTRQDASRDVQEGWNAGARSLDAEQDAAARADQLLRDIAAARDELNAPPKPRPIQRPPVDNRPFLGPDIDPRTGLSTHASDDGNTSNVIVALILIVVVGFIIAEGRHAR